jgi:hypothetical protein
VAIGNTKYHALLRKQLLLSDAVAWMEFFTTKNKEAIINMITERLYDTGEDKLGDIIGLYEYETELASGGEKQEGDPYTLKDSGEFYESIFISVFNDLFEINDGQGAEKMKNQDWWTDDIVGFNEEQKDEVIKMIRKHYLDYAKKILLGVK